MMSDDEVETFREQDKLLRAGVTENLSSWLKKLNCGGDEEKKLEYKMRMVKKLRCSPVAVEVEKANEQHYEVPTGFFKTILGKRLKYSSCLYTKDTANIDQAEEKMMDLVCKRARVDDGQTIMDLGCGWGSMALWICENYPNCKVLCVSNSQTQRHYIEREAQANNYSDRLHVITADANVFTTSMKFDRIISIEMFEHMKNYETLMSRVSTWLKPHGLLFIQVLCHCKFAYEFKTKSGSDTEWMARNFFSGGTMASSDLFLYFQKDMYTVDHWQINGKNYTKTLDAWLDKLYDNLDEVKAILAANYGDNNVTQHLFNWRMFLLYCSETFGFNDGNDWLLSQMLFKKRIVSSL